MSIGRICQREVILADPDEPITKAAERMERQLVGTLVVLDRDKRPIGVLTDRDIAMRVVAAGRDPQETTVDDVMTRHPRSVMAGTPIEDTLATMRTLGIRRILVVGHDERLAGIASMDDILGLIMEEFRSVHGILQKSCPSGVLV